MKKTIIFIFLLNIAFIERFSLACFSKPYLLDAPPNIMDEDDYQGKEQVLTYSCASACIISVIKELNSQAMSYYCDEYLDKLELAIHRQVNMSKYKGLAAKGSLPTDIVKYFEDNSFFKVKAFEYFNLNTFDSIMTLLSLPRDLKRNGEVLYRTTRGLPRVAKNDLKNRLQEGNHLIIPFLSNASGHFFHIRMSDDFKDVIFMDPTFGSNHRMPWKVFKKIIYQKQSFSIRGELYRFFGSIILLEESPKKCQTLL